MLGVSGSQGFVGYARSDASMSVSDKVAPHPRNMLVSADSTGIRVSRLCTAARRIPLTRRGLPGPPSLFQAYYDCAARPKRILVRIRAVAAASAPWTRQPPAQLDLQKAVSRAEMRVQAPNGRSIAYVTIAGKQIRLWIAPDCIRS
jgi:hypothetical protein